MNVCCGENVDRIVDLPLEDVPFNIDKTELKFLVGRGYYVVYDTNDENNPYGQKKKELNDIDLKMQEKNKEITDYKIKIEDLNNKIKYMEKILLMDEKEQQYIQHLGENNDF